MSRTPLFAAVKEALALASRDDPVVGPRTSALTRRRMPPAICGRGRCHGARSRLQLERTREEPEPSWIAIIGGGVAGLTATYSVLKHGAKPVLFEASNRSAASVHAIRVLQGHVLRTGR